MGANKFDTGNIRKEQESIQVGCVPPPGQPHVGVGCHPWGGVASLRGGGASLRGVPQEVASWNTPVNRIIDRCKNITFPQFHLRAINIFGRNANLVC